MYYLTFISNMSNESHDIVSKKRLLLTSKPNLILKLKKGKVTSWET